MSNKTLSILKWVGIALACLSTVFTLVIVGSHLSGRLIGMGKVGIIGTVGAELMAIICAWLAVAEEKRVAGVAMICQIVLTAVLLINASIALDMDWQETLANKAAERTLTAQKTAAEEQRKTIEKQAEVTGQLIAKQAEAAGLLAQTDKRLARDFVRTNKTATTSLLPTTDPTPKQTATEPVEAAPLDISKMSIYERYGLTVVPLFLGLLTVIALGLAAHSGGDATASQPSKRNASTDEFPSHLEPAASYRSQPNKGKFNSRVATQADPERRSVATQRDANRTTIATQSDAKRSRVATQAAPQDGLAILRNTLRDIAFKCPGKWFKVDARSAHLLIRLNRREQGKEVTEQSDKFKLDLLTEAVEMPPDKFRARLTRLLIKKGFQIEEAGK